jgi:hypothetical protein
MNNLISKQDKWKEKNATSHCHHHEKSRRGHLFHPFLTFHISYPVIPMFIIFADLKRREKHEKHNPEN